MNIRKILIAVLAIVFISCGRQDSKLSLTISNNSDFSRIDEPIELPVSEITAKHKDFDANKFIVFDGDKEIPSQLSITNDGAKIIFVCDLNSGEKKNIEIKYGSGVQKKNYTSRVFAGLAKKKGDVYYDGKFRGDEFEFVDKYKVPSIHKDHDALFKCEGPTWESDKVGYRFYLDWRNATDIFGKKTSDLVLREVGQHDTVASDDSYHHMQEWGMDIFKVGSSLGIGSIAMMDSDKVTMVAKTDSNFFDMISNGPVQASFKTSYYGWEVGGNKYDLESYISIDAGSRLTEQKLVVSNNAENIATGLAKYEGTKYFEKSVSEGWSYIALYGKQTLVDENDELGIALIYKGDELVEKTEDKLNHVVVLKPQSGKVAYYYCAAWDQEPGGIKSEDEFVSYLDAVLQKLNNPVKVEL